MRITEYQLVKKFLNWWLGLSEMIQRITIFIILLIWAGTSWIMIYDMPLIVWYMAFLLFGICVVLIVAGLWVGAENIVKEIKKWKITN